MGRGMRVNAIEFARLGNRSLRSFSIPDRPNICAFHIMLVKLETFCTRCAHFHSASATLHLRALLGRHLASAHASKSTQLTSCPAYSAPNSKNSNHANALNAKSCTHPCHVRGTRFSSV